MTVRTYHLLDGNGVTVEASPELDAFLTRARQMSSAADLEALIYGPENPLLEPLAIGHTVTAQTIRHPAWRVLQDLLERRRDGSAEIPGRYTMPIEAAAAKLELSVEEVLELIGRGLIAAAERRGTTDAGIYCDPATVKAMRVCATKAVGDAGGLVLHLGSREGLAMHAKTPADATRRWRRAAVKITEERNGAKTIRMIVLEADPGGTFQVVKAGPYSVSGRFRIVDQKRGRSAVEGWLSFRPI